MGTITKENRLFLFINKIDIETVQIWCYIYRSTYRHKGLFLQKDTLKVIKAVLVLRTELFSIEMAIEIVDVKDKPENKEGKKMRKNNQGFTLVELIVVLVILAILAAILVPALLGYIDQAKDNQDILNARPLYTSAQTVASEYYGKDKIINFPQDGDFNNDVLKLSDLSSDDFQYAYIGFGKNDTDSHSKYTVEMVVYYNKKGVMFFMKDGNAWQRCESGEEDSVIQDLDSNYKHALVMDLPHQ